MTEVRYRNISLISVTYSIIHLSDEFVKWFSLDYQSFRHSFVFARLRLGAVVIRGAFQLPEDMLYSFCPAQRDIFIGILYGSNR